MGRERAGASHCVLNGEIACRSVTLFTEWGDSVPECHTVH